MGDVDVGRLSMTKAILNRVDQGAVYAIVCGDRGGLVSRSWVRKHLRDDLHGFPATVGEGKR